MRDAALRVIVRLPVPRPAQPETALHHALSRAARRAPLLLEARAAREVGVRALQLTPEADGGVAGALPKAISDEIQDTLAGFAKDYP